MAANEIISQEIEHTSRLANGGSETQIPLTEDEKNEFTIKYWNLAIGIAKRNHKATEGNADLDDKISDGLFGLIKAVNKIDKARLTKPGDEMKLLVPDIRGEVKRGIRDRKGYIDDKFEDQKHRDKRKHTVISGRAISFSEHRNNDAEDLSLEETISDPEQKDVIEICDGRAKAASINSVVREAPFQQREIFFYRYYYDLTQNATAERVGTYQMRVSRTLRQLESNVLHALDTRQS
jgi:RNA polymerase sigma factor (sigma-70 family)